MFKFLKEKISSWTKNLSKKSKDEEEIEQIVKEKREEIKEKPKKKERNKFVHTSPKMAQEEVIEVKKEIPKEKKSETKKVEEHEFTEPEKKEIDKEERGIGQKVWNDIEKEETEKKGFFQRIKEKFGKTKISEEDFNEYSEDLEMSLIENNVAVEVAEKIIKRLKEEIVEREVQKKDLEKEIKNSLKQIIEEILIEPFDLVEEIKKKKEKPFVILFCGINGTGKTTTIAKIADLLNKNKISSVLVAGDTFRAASIEQLKKHSEKLKVKIIAHEYGSDPASVGFDAIKFAEKNKIECVLIDTAGRMHTAKNLMAQIEKVAKVTKPDCKIFVGESTTGNDIIEQIKTFDESVKIDGIILSKADIDEKGGTALSVGMTTGKPILYLGTGQEYKDLEKFDKKKFVEKLGL